MSSNTTPAAERVFAPRVVVVGLLLLLATDAALWLMGRRFISDSGFGLWSGAWSHDTSQWIADPYSASHVLHGIFLYWMLWPLSRWLSAGTRLIAAMVVESGWELLENSPAVVERYRANTASLDYFGDSILNSTGDILCAIVGFWIAWRFGWKWMVGVILAIELLMLYFVRDNLTLNVLMLIHPSEAIKCWQMGG
jgi:hypothetical protein